MDAVTFVPAPYNEPVRSYAPGSPERASLEAELKRLAAADPISLTATIGGQERVCEGPEFTVVQPHNHAHVLGVGHAATRQDAEDAIAAAAKAAPAWRAMSFEERAAIFLKAADLLTGPWRDTLNAATMLGQSKTAYQAEIEAACELADFWRFNVGYARDILKEQPPVNPHGSWNRLDHRPLEGFVYAITPFNFTAIAGNLPTAPALMGNVVLWKPSPTQQYSAHFTMRLLEEAGLPAGVINMLPGDGIAVSEVALTHPDLAGIHFTGSTATFQRLWKTVGENIANYRTYPRLVGETGGKDFVVAHPSADVDAVRVALIRGAYEFSGQKCSAASRAFIARSVWEKLEEGLVREIEDLAVGDPADFSNFTAAVIDARSFAKNKAAIDRAHAEPGIEVLAGGTYDDSVGWFIRPTLVRCDDPTDEVFTTEYFGPFLAVHVYEDDQFDAILDTVDTGTAYGLTGAVLSQDRAAVARASEKLRFAAGNFYINDKPTGAVVGQQPFGGARASGTDDKAGSPLNLLRWTAPRVIKETFVPPKDHRYPHMG